MAEKRLKASIIIGGLLDGSLRDALSSTKNGFRQIGDAMRGAQREQRHLKQEIRSLATAGQSVSDTTRRYNLLTESIDRARAASSRLRLAEARRGRAEQTSSRLQSGAVRVGAVGAAGVVPIVSGVRAAQEMQTETARVEGLGLGEKATREALNFARTVRGYGTSQVAAVELMRDALAAFGNVEDARNAIPTLEKIRFGNQALYGSERGGENTRQFMDMLRVIDSRGGATSRAEFARQSDHIQRVISATGNRVTAEQWRELVQHAGIAGKSMSNDAFYYQLEPLINDMGSGSTVGTGVRALYNDLYQGHTTVRAARNLEHLGLIGDRTKVRYDKAGQTAQLNPGALLGADLFRTSQFDWMRKVLIPQLAKHGITDRQAVLDTIGSIVTNSTGATTLGNMYTLQPQIERDENLASHAHGVDETYQAGQRTTTGQQIGAHSQIDDLRLRLGTQLLPLYTSALQRANDALSRLNSFTERHPALARNLALGIAGGTAALLVATPVMIGAGAALNAYAGFALLAARREAMLTAATLANNTATEAAAVAQGASSAASVASMVRFSGWKPLLGSVRSSFRRLGQTLRSAGKWEGPLGIALGRATFRAALLAGAVRKIGLGRLALRGLMMAIEPIGVLLSGLLSPIGLAVGALVVGAVMVHRYWQPIKAFLGGMWSGFSEGVAPAVGQVMAHLRPLGAMLTTAAHWVMNLLSPVKQSAGDFQAAQSAGVRFGHSLATAMSGALDVLGHIIDGLGWMMRNGGRAIAWTQSTVSRGWHWLTGPQNGQEVDQGNAGGLVPGQTPVAPLAPSPVVSVMPIVPASPANANSVPAPAPAPVNVLRVTSQAQPTPVNVLPATPQVQAASVNVLPAAPQVQAKPVTVLRVNPQVQPAPITVQSQAPTVNVQAGEAQPIVTSPSQLPVAPDPVQLPAIPEITHDNRRTIHRDGDTHTHHYHIHQQPGESSDDLARRIQQAQQRNERTRSTLFDQAD